MITKKLIYCWYALHTKSRFENVVDTCLKKKNIEVFSPKIRAKSQRRDRCVMIYKPLFPGYVFVKTDLNPKGYFEILKTHGVVGLIGNTTGPIHVPDNDIESLKIMVAGEKEIATGTQLKKGDKVVVINGPFAGVAGIFERYRGKERVIVNFEALGQFAAINVNKEDIEMMPPHMMGTR